MKDLTSKIIALLLSIAFSFAHAEVYSWVDKEGKKHFGQEVPKEYANQSKVLDVKEVNSMDATKVTPAAPQRKTYTQQPANPLPTQQDDYTPNLTKCEQQKLAYENSVKCYARCRNSDARAAGVNNVAACNCVDAKKPNC
ncbi:hypothetical protein GCM10011613_36510 [Cellvibrio zantedeschiae]|uniref:DUF4124 domain-containing protein n=1 Tax=Cellvibrio zantedeschiae TaxID=1237077 RepID=A0ABQ3BAY1_9GAMM|nr:DUF4124 domain-containing protein [Cellvibrio zantedeschiae]GGY88159.1 hypothetical protein GCM10011613_36510 [Cellvibrio zantedeschiae]